VGLLGFIGEDLRQSGFRPAAFELRIDDQPGCVPPVELPDGLGHTVRVVGTIDRVDTMPGPGGRTWVRVVDYKTGSKKFDLREVYCGLDCQMLLYLFTLERSGGALFPNPAAAGVEYLLADPAPKTEDRPDGGAEPAAYPVEGLLLDEEEVYRAMDQRGTGRFVPLRFSEKTGAVNAASRRHLAGEAKLARIRDHLDGMVTGMARDLYNGKIPASPLCAGRTPCDYCDYRLACPRAGGEAERAEIPQNDPFE